MGFRRTLLIPHIIPFESSERSVVALVDLLCVYCVCCRDHMRLLVMVAVLLCEIGGADPTTLPTGPASQPKSNDAGGRTKMRYTPNPELKRRDEILRTLFFAHPHWTGQEVMEAVQPLLRAAGLKPIKVNLLRVRLVALRKELKASREYHRLAPEHTTFLNEEFAWDPDQLAAAVYGKFLSVWGPGAVSKARVLGWWYNTLRRVRLGVTTAAPLMALQSVSPDPSHLPSPNVV